MIFLQICFEVVTDVSGEYLFSYGSQPPTKEGAQRLPFRTYPLQRLLSNCCAFRGSLGKPNDPAEHRRLAEREVKWPYRTCHLGYLWDIVYTWGFSTSVGGMKV